MVEASGLAPQLNAAMMAQAMRYATPATLPYVQRSAYLADALQSMREHGGDNLKTPLALGSNLLATALDQFASRGANADLAHRGQANQSAYEDGLQSLAQSLGAVGPGGGQMPSPGGGQSPAPGGPGPAPSAPMSAPQGAPPVPGPAMAAPAGPTSPAPGADPLLAHVVQHFTGEGYSPGAAAGLAGSFQAESNLNPTSLNPTEGAFGLANWTGPRRQALMQFAQAKGLDPNSVDAQLAFTDAELAGPESHARGLLLGAQTPQQGAAAALAYERPAGYQPGGDPGQASRWPVRLGNAESAFAQSQAPTGQPSSATASQAAPVPRPVQISNGPDPSVPAQGAPGPVGASPFAAQSTQPAVQAANGASMGPPTGQPATPQEIATVRAYMASPYPEMKAEGEKLMQSIIARHATPIAAPEKMQWDGQQGRFVPLPGAGYSQLQSGPNGGIQANPFGERSTYANPNVGALGPNQISNPDGSVSNRAVQQQQMYKIPGAAGWFVNGPDGKPQQAGQDTIAPKDIQGSRDSWRTNDDVKKANEGIAAYNGITSAISKFTDNNGVLSTAALDSYLRGINPGMGAKNATVTMFLDHLGLPTELKGWVQSNIQGDGYLTPETMGQMVKVIRSYAEAHGSIAQGLADNDLKSFQQYGQPVTADQLGERLTPLSAPPSAAWAGGPGHPAPGGLPAGWPVINGQAVDPNSTAGQHAQALIAKGYRFQNGGWTK